MGVLAKHRDRNVEVLRVASYSVKSAGARKLAKQKQLKLKGSIQPVRESMFEPMVSAMKRVERQAIAAQRPDQGMKTKRLGIRSQVLLEVGNAHRALDRTLPPDESRSTSTKAKIKTTRVHAAARRGHLAMAAKRFAKQPKQMRQPQRVVNNSAFDAWLSTQFGIQARS